MHVKRKWIVRVCLLGIAGVPVAWHLFGRAEISDLERDTRRYSQYPDGKVYARLLQLRHGDSLRRVSSFLGSPISITRDKYVFEIYREAMQKNPLRYPDGVADEDSFAEFCCVQPGSIWLQFRNDILVNYDPANFRDLLDYK